MEKISRNLVWRRESLQSSTKITVGISLLCQTVLALLMIVFATLGETPFALTYDFIIVIIVLESEILSLFMLVTITVVLTVYYPLALQMSCRRSDFIIKEGGFLLGIQALVWVMGNVVVVIVWLVFTGENIWKCVTPAQAKVLLIIQVLQYLMVLPLSMLYVSASKRGKVRGILVGCCILVYLLRTMLAPESMLSLIYFVPLLFVLGFVLLKRVSV